MPDGERTDLVQTRPLIRRTEGAEEAVPYKLELGD